MPPGGANGDILFYFRAHEWNWDNNPYTFKYHKFEKELLVKAYKSVESISLNFLDAGHAPVRGFRALHAMREAPSEE
jgi:hypothetical protein